MVQISKGSGPRFRVQVLEAALCIYMEITLRHRCSHFAAYLRTSFYKNTFKGLLLFLFIFCHSLISLDLLYVGRAKFPLLKRILVNIGEAQCLQMFFIVGARD